MIQRLRIAKEILAHYDKDNDGKLTREEIGLPADLFEGLDRNQDGKLDPIELLRWLVALPDAEAAVPLEAQPPARPAWGRAMHYPRGPARACGARPTTSCPLTLDDAQVNLVRPPAVAGRNAAANPRGYFAQFFTTLDKRAARLRHPQAGRTPMGAGLRLALEWRRPRRATAS